MTEGEPVAAGAGRPMVPLRPASGTLLAIGLEIAADHISCLGIDLTGAELARRTTYHRVAEGTAEDALALAAQLVHEVREEAPELTVVGVTAAIPGRLSPEDGRILSAPGLDWADVPVISRLQELLAPAAWPVGAQAHIGNKVAAGDVLPAMIVAVQPNGQINAQVFLDGNDVLWVTSRDEASEESGSHLGRWHWPQR